MNFNTHSYLADKHALLPPSTPHWLRYNDDKVDRVYHSSVAARRGEALHKFACDAITLGVRLPDNGTTLNSYVNDAIRFRMRPEVVLFFSENCFGRVDAISFRKDLLRIHDLKTGVAPTSEEQLMVYAALFCLEYNVQPLRISYELRIYQNDEVKIFEPEPDSIVHVVERIKYLDRRLALLRKGLA